MLLKNPVTIALFLLFNTLTMVVAQSAVFDIQGHRGARGLAPENTIPAFIRAIDEGVTTLELDVVITRDKKVVVSHEPYFNPHISTDPDGKKVTAATQANIYMMPYKTVKRYDVGRRGNALFPEQRAMQAHKPLLKKMIKAAEKYAKQKGVPPLNYNIELKSLPEEYDVSQPSPPEFSDLAHKVIFKRLPPERVTVQSFDFAILQHWHNQIAASRYPACTLSALIEPEENNEVERNLIMLGFKPDIWSPYFKVVTPEMVNQLHQAGIKVIPWTVNEVKDMRKIKSMGCDGLITDYPDRAKSLTE